MNVSTSNLTPRAINWIVGCIVPDDLLLRAHAECTAWVLADSLDFLFEPATVWDHGGPIIERERIVLTMYDDRWRATIHVSKRDFCESGPTPLIAAMRCFICSRIGDQVSIPDSMAEVEEETDG